MTVQTSFYINIPLAMIYSCFMLLLLSVNICHIIPCLHVHDLTHQQNSSSKMEIYTD